MSAKDRILMEMKRNVPMGRNVFLSPEGEAFIVELERMNKRLIEMERKFRDDA